MAKQAYTYQAADDLIRKWLGAGEQSATKQSPGVPSGNVVETPVKAGFTPYDKLSPISQYNVKRTDALTVVREHSTKKGTAGTMWYKGQVVGVTLEDPIRKDGFTRGDTAISKGEYKISLDTTNNQNLTGNYMTFQNGPNLKYSNPGVFPRILGVPNQQGIRIHAGGTKADSLGCVLFSKTRKPNHIDIQYSLNDSRWLTKLIYNNGIRSIILINEWDHKK